MDVITRNTIGLVYIVVCATIFGEWPSHAAPQKVPATTAHVANSSAVNVLRSFRVAKIPMPQPRPQAALGETRFRQVGVVSYDQQGPSHPTVKSLLHPSATFALAPSTAVSATDIAAIRRVIEDARLGKQAEADATEATISDPVARKLAEWIILRSDKFVPSFQRYAAFIRANPSWPHISLFRHRAENALWNDHLDDNTVRMFFAANAPTTAKGRYALARVLLARGDQDGAASQVRYGWRHDECNENLETNALEIFGPLLSRADHKIRMEQRLYAGDISGGLRAAERLGGNDLLIARARAAVIKGASNAKALLDAVPSSAQHDPGYIFARVQWLSKHNKIDEASTLILNAPSDPDIVVDPDQWWVERRLLVRKLLDEHKAQIAYRIARDAAVPKRGNYRADQQFTAGWIALRFLNDPTTASKHFARIIQDTNNPFALSRGGYWQGRAAEALGRNEQARKFYEAAAQHSATYYGQIARAKLGMTDLGLHQPPSFTFQERGVLNNLEITRAVSILYELNEHEMLASIFAALGETADDIAGAAMLAEIANKHEDGHAMVLLSRAAFNRGLPLEYYAYPVVGLPNYTPITTAVSPAVVYSIARQESEFNQKVVSPAHAMGLMQVTPGAARDTAKRFNAPYNRGRLLSDPVYNMQMGAAELSMLLDTYNGSYILAFAGYNAGRGRVKQWIAAYGDPRDPNVDPVDWVERIPISETRNYVQRIIENLQVYRARFSGGNKLLIEADLKRGALN
jgi:soluble lytic murein transglycosylase